MNSRKIVKNVLIANSIFLLTLLFVTYLGINILPFQLNPGSGFVYNSDYGNFFERWSNWDGKHFRGIAENGYQSFQTVFFPLYPLLIKALTLLGFPSLWAGLLISAASTIFALFYLYKLSLLEFKEKANDIIFFLLIFPTSFYLIAVYSESLFLALTIASFYFAKKKNYKVSFILAGLSLTTRLAGVATISGIAINYLISEKRKEIPKLFLYLLFSLIPFSAYLIYLTYQFQSPLAFLTSQQLWQRAMTLPNFTIGNFLFLIEFAKTSNIIKAQLIIQYVFLVMLIALLIISFKKLPKPYFFYFLISLAIPLSSGTLTDLPRYTLVMFPIFFAIALIKNDYVKKSWIALSLALLTLFSVLFINGYPLI